MQKHGHILYLDFLRLVALFLVVLLHVSGRELLFSGKTGLEKAWGIANAFDSMCRCAVPVFVMISGALFLGREISVKRLYSKYVIRIVRVFAIWTVFYAMDALILCFERHDALLPAEFVAICLKGHYHLWFLPMIACLYLIVPFLRQIAHDAGLCRLYLLLGFVFAFLVPQAVAMVKLLAPWWGEVCVQIVGNMNAHFFLGYSVYFMWGYWLHHHPLSDRFVWICAFLGLSGVVATIWLTSYATKCAGVFDGRFYEASNVTVFLPATALFAVCKRWMGKVGKDVFCSRKLASLAQLCLGAYLIHAFFFEHLARWLNLSELELHPLGAIPAISLVVFVLSLVAAALLARIPFLGKWLF